MDDYTRRSTEHLSNLQYNKIVDTNFADVQDIATKSLTDSFVSSVVRYGVYGQHHISNVFYKEQMAYEQGLATPLELKAAKYNFLFTWQKLYN